jgi:hypothetical protein
MTDIEYMTHAFKGDLDAVGLMLSVVKIADVWDNLIDGDVPVAKEDIDRAFWLACVDIPRNPVFRRYQLDLAAVFSMGIVNWKVSDQLVKGDLHAKQIAHVTRYAIADVALYLATAIGGPEWAAQVGPELRLRSQKDRLEDYLKEHGHEQAS